jgi:zinc transport system substrate-binding protein
VTERVAGDGWTVDNLTQPGQEPHDLDLTIAQTASLESADLVVLEEGFQPAVDAAAENTDAPVLDAAAVVELIPATEGDHDHEGESEDEHAEEEGHAEEEEGHDDHGDLDPHFWLDPLLVADFADSVADELAEVDPDGAQTYADNAAALRAELESLDEDYTSGLASCERSTTVVSHQAFAYLTRYGLEFEAIAGLSPDAEPTAADLAHLQEVIEADGVTTVFSERLVSPKMAETLADDLGVTTAVLDPLEGLSDETADEDYLSIMRSNLSALQQANGCS